MERRNRNILIALIAVVIVAAVFSSFGLGFFGVTTPTITLPTPAPTESGAPGGVEQPQGERVEVTPDTVQSVIAALSRLESYSRMVVTTLEGESATATVWVDGGWTRADLTLPTGRTACTVVGDGTVWRWYDGDGRAVSWAADSSSMDVEGQRIPTYEDVLALNKEDITAAGYEDKEGSPCVYVEVAIPELGQTERYWVSVENGLLWYAETVVGEETVWSMSASLPEVPAPAGDFTLPDGTVLHTVGE